MTDGVPMGSPLSGLIAEIFMSNFEEIFFNHKYHFFTKHIISYHRYVDDILIIHKGSRANLIALQNILNNISCLEFTYELEREGRLTFLDIELLKNKNSDTLTFNIFRKPTQTDNIIPALSASPTSHKKAVFHFLFNRIYNIPLSEQLFNEEVNKIVNLGLRNGYNINWIQNLYNRQYYNNNIIKIIYPHSSTKPRFVTIQYNTEHVQVLSPILKNHGMQLAYRSNHNLKSSLMNNKIKPPDLAKSGVYKINCDICNKIYIGQSGRKISDRLKEHIKDKNSPMGIHLADTGHTINNNNIQLLHHVHKSQKMNLLEEMEIQRHKLTQPDLLLNDIIYSNKNRLFLNVLDS